MIEGRDILIRYKRLAGFEALWVPGTDHAGIATQAKVDARLKDEGLSRYDLGREKFLEESEDCRLLFRPDGLEFYVQKADAGGTGAGGTWKRYRVEFEYD